MVRHWTCNSLVDNSSRSVRELSDEPRKDLSLCVISCRLIFQEVRWLPSHRFSGVRLTGNSSKQGGIKYHQNFKRLGPMLRWQLRKKLYSLNEEKENKKLFLCSCSASR